MADIPKPRLGDALNAQHSFYGPPRPAPKVAEALRLRVLGLYERHLAADGHALNYKALGADPGICSPCVDKMTAVYLTRTNSHIAQKVVAATMHCASGEQLFLFKYLHAGTTDIVCGRCRADFKAFVDATAELQKVDVGGLSRAERMAFWINIYNILVVQPPLSALWIPVGVLPTMVQQVPWSRVGRHHGTLTSWNPGMYCIPGACAGGSGAGGGNAGAPALVCQHCLRRGRPALLQQ